MTISIEKSFNSMKFNFIVTKNYFNLNPKVLGLLLHKKKISESKLVCEIDDELL